MVTYLKLSGTRRKKHGENYIIMGIITDRIIALKGLDWWDM